MAEILRYVGEDLGVVLEKMIKLENQVGEASLKTHKEVNIETEIKFYFDTDEWEGLVIITDAKEDRGNNKRDVP